MTAKETQHRPVIVGPAYLEPLLHRSVSTIKVDARRKPESLPPRLIIPGSSKLLWVETDVLNWIDKCRQSANDDKPASGETPPPRSIIKRQRRA